MTEKLNDEQNSKLVEMILNPPEMNAKGIMDVMMAALDEVYGLDKLQGFRGVFVIEERVEVNGEKAFATLVSATCCEAHVEPTLIRAIETVSGAQCVMTVDLQLEKRQKPETAH